MRPGLGRPGAPDRVQGRLSDWDYVHQLVTEGKAAYESYTNYTHVPITCALCSAMYMYVAASISQFGTRREGGGARAWKPESRRCRCCNNNNNNNNNDNSNNDNSNNNNDSSNDIITSLRITIIIIVLLITVIGEGVCASGSACQRAGDERECVRV